ncbi:hypothetical protein TRFO_04162 [Tritrichomonas foetus]|uniref:Abnormal spindle-like microcephaly-associated protein ASH domain-containing protein n=1 Tax=Tritrichomonas foetus TaxID=1144522 RepID=A0A1J4KLI6_9EUKA|nr:hypothetical protein TRFO_04162 [Tritrichomonas foetus]|eukprot:OHT10660.1 hypothetical protein TRFO_04162 [Tritrichomonas foetus]
MSQTKKDKKQKSQPFISDPGVLVFRDFVIGETMNLPFTLTNVSFGRNTYKVIGFDKEFEALFHLNFSPPGYISPGVAVNLSLDFTPKYNSPIKCPLHCLAETGPFDVLVECYPKIVNIQIDPFDVFNIGVVTLGEEKEQSIIIRNSGALQATWSISLETAPVDPGFLSLSEAEDGVVQFSTRHGVTQGYSSSTIKVNFRPARPCQLKFILRFKFSSSHKEFDSFVKDLPLEGTGADVPIFLENDKIDFGVCYYNELYRATLVAHNRSNLSQRFVIETPPNLEKFVEFMPKVGFVQPMSSLQITIKLRTSNKFTSQFPQFESTAEIPIRMTVVNQVLPVDFSISFTPSSLKLSFDPPQLDFGTFITTECKEVPLRITSSLQLPCNFGFIRLPNGVSVKPFDGFGLILPGETVEVTVCFQSQIPKKHEFPIQLAILQGQKFNIPCVATVCQSPISFSQTDIEFEATPLGSDSSYKLIVNNSRAQPLDFEFETPDDFLFDPVVGTVPANSKSPVFVTFRPTVPIQQPEVKQEDETAALTKTGNSTTKKDNKKHNSKQQHHKDKKKSETEEPGEDPKEIISPDFTYRLYEKSIACFWKSGSNNGRHHISMKAAAILPTLFITKVAIGSQHVRKSEDYIDLSLNKINFGIVATGQFLDAIIEIKSVIKKTLALDYVCERGSFEVLSPSCELRPLQSTELHIRFAPCANMKYKSTVQIRCADRPNSRITLSLNGEGAAPSIALSQESLDFGHVVVGHSITRSIQVKNNANFAQQYTYELKPTPTMHNKNMSGNDAFTVPVKTQRLQPGETGDASVNFSPDHDDLTFQSILVISAGEDGEKCEVPITGAAWPHVMFIMGGVEEPRQRTAFDHYALDEPYFRPNVICEMAYPGPAAQTTLTFGVANQNEDVKKTNGEFSFDNLSGPGFTITPMKSSVECGGVAKAVIEYAPPASSLLQVGQWVVAESNINLKCAEFQRKVPFKIKCLINLQQAADLSQATTTRQSKSTAKRKSRK